MRKTAIITNESKFIKADRLLFIKLLAKVFVFFILQTLFTNKYFSSRTNPYILIIAYSA